jgi:hypothetical protein
VLIPVAKRSSARDCGSLLAGIAGSNPAGSMDVCVVRCKEKIQDNDDGKKQVRMKYKHSTRENKKFRWEHKFVCVCVVKEGQKAKSQGNEDKRNVYGKSAETKRNKITNSCKNFVLLQNVQTASVVTPCSTQCVMR